MKWDRAISLVPSYHACPLEVGFSAAIPAGEKAKPDRIELRQKEKAQTRSMREGKKPLRLGKYSKTERGKREM